MVMEATKPMPTAAIPTNTNTDGNSGIVVSSKANPTNQPISTVATARKVCVAGFAEATREVANRLPKDYQIWSLNRCYSFLRRWDRWYELHEEELYTGKTGLRENDYLDVLKKSKVPIIMLNPLPIAEFPMVQKFPHAEISNRFRDYFTNSIGYMLSHAAYEHVTGSPITELTICGVDMSAYSEYNEQRPCVEYWLGVLEGLGVKVIIPAASPLLKAAVTYGKRDRQVLWQQGKERIQHHKTKQQELTAQLNAAIGINGDLEQVQKLIKDGKGLTEVKGWVDNRKKEIQNAHVQINADLNAEVGALRECQHWLTIVNAPQSESEEPESIKIVK